jgi:hypothetical protein
MPDGDIATLLLGLRPEVEPIVLDAAVPAARQMAAVLEGRRGLDAVHVVAHGSPGRVRLAKTLVSLSVADDFRPDRTNWANNFSMGATTSTSIHRWER